MIDLQYSVNKTEAEKKKEKDKKKKKKKKNKKIKLADIMKKEKSPYNAG